MRTGVRSQPTRDSEDETPRLVAISLGAGIQSTVLALMADLGEFGVRPDVAIFADTGWEPPHVYEHIEWLESELSFPIHRVARETSLRERVRAITSHTGHEGFLDIPVFLKGDSPAENGIGARRCTTQYKIRPIRWELRRLLGYGRKGTPPPGSAEQWLGISMDEVIRMRDSDVQWIVNRYPLVDAGMSRRDCIQWWAERYDRPLLKSACIGCPYQEAQRWVETKHRYPDQFDELVFMDTNLRQSGLRYARDAYFHPARMPLAKAVRMTESEGSGGRGVDGFGNECSGHCGV